MSVFALRPYVFYKYAFVLMEYVILFLNIFLYFMEPYDNASTYKNVFLNLIFPSNLEVYFMSKSS